MDTKVCTIKPESLEYGSCMKRSRCCRNCKIRPECEFPCQLSYDENCKYYKGAKEWDNNVRKRS